MSPPVSMRELKQAISPASVTSQLVSIARVVSSHLSAIFWLALVRAVRILSAESSVLQSVDGMRPVSSLY
jgi:hypothetical protein